VADLTTNVAGLELENPFILASGPLSYNGAAILRAYRAGAGAIVTKTISRVPATNPIPHIAQVSGGLLNTEKWSDLPYERWIEHEIPYAKEGGATVIGSVGLTPADVALLAQPISDAGADALEVVSYDGSVLVSMVREAAGEVEIPILAKVSSNWPDVVEIAAACLRNGAAGITAIDSVGPVLRIDVDKRAPLLGGGYAWLTGRGIFPIALRIVSEIALATASPIVGTGGIWEADNVLEMMMAGAHAVGICSLAILRGIETFCDLSEKLSARLDELGYGSVRDVIGVALPTLHECGHPGPVLSSTQATETSFVLDNERCTECGICVRICPYQARISPREADPAACRLCGLCASACPTGALALDVGGAQR